MFVDGANGIRPIGDGLLEVTDASLSSLIANGDINEIYDVEQAPFARGKFATVRRAMHKKTGVSFAAKFLRRRRRAQCTLKEIRHEIAILLLCADSEHIVKLHSVHETNAETALVLEMATGGELQALLDEAGSLSEAQTTICMQEVLKALQYLHKKSIAHLDLKPQNILLCGKRVEDGLKLCDFGISRIVEETGGKVREILGTPDYVAPEVLSYEPLSLKTDVWSVGVLAYVLLSGFSPFGGDTKQETFLNISQCNLTFPDDLFEDASEDAKDFIKCALQVTAEDRMTAYECLQHKWLCENQSIKNQPKDNMAANVATEFYSLFQNVDTNNITETEQNTPTQMPTPPSAKSSAGFFLHKNQKNGTSLENAEASSSSSNESSSFKIIANTTTTPTKLSASITIENHHRIEPLGTTNGDFCTPKDLDCLKPTATTNNNVHSSSNGSSCNSNSTSALLKDYKTNKENINLSKILVNRIAPMQTQPSPQLINNINKGITLINNNNCAVYEYTDDSSATTNGNNNISAMLTTQVAATAPLSSVSAATAKYESILFPDAPTTPKVSRKSIIELATSTPSCVTLVKQFQLSAGNNGSCSHNRIDFDEITVPESTYSTTSSNNKLFQSRCDDHIHHLNHLTTAAAAESSMCCANPREITYRSATTTTTTIATSNSSNLRSLSSSTLSINTVTESSAAIATGSSITVNCLCGVDKASNCCCSASSRTALNYRKKSLAVVDNSILC